MGQPLLLVLYSLCAVLLSGGALYLSIRESKSASVRWFVGICLSLLIWLVTLFLFLRSSDPGFILWAGRANFASVSLAVYFGWRFVKEVSGKPSSSLDRPLLYASVALALLSAFTQLIDKAELVGVGLGARHETIYGPLFPLYAVHVVGLLAAAVYEAFRGSRRQVRHPHRRDQLLLLGWGILATGAIGLVCNALLPYALGNFTFIDFGPLSTLLFLFSVAYAIARHQLFDIRVFLRRTLVLGIALSLVLAAYSAIVLLATDRFASSESGGVTRFGVLVLAFSFDPVRRFLESRIDKLLFPERPRRGRLT
jgi:hypothetical protein